MVDRNLQALAGVYRWSSASVTLRRQDVEVVYTSHDVALLCIVALGSEYRYAIGRSSNTGLHFREWPSSTFGELIRRAWH